MADARVRVQEPLQICLESRSKSKKCDKQLTHIVRVSGMFFSVFESSFQIGDGLFVSKCFNRVSPCCIPALQSNNSYYKRESS